MTLVKEFFITIHKVVTVQFAAFLSIFLFSQLGSKQPQSECDYRR